MVDEVLELKGQKDKLYEAYKKSVESTNALISKRKTYYNSILEAMIQLEQSKTAYAKSLLNKYVNLFDRILRTFLEKIANFGATLGTVKPELEAKGRLSPLNENSILFMPVKCVEYDSEYVFAVFVHPCFLKISKQQNKGSVYTT